MVNQISHAIFVYAIFYSNLLPFHDLYFLPFFLEHKEILNEESDHMHSLKDECLVREKAIENLRMQTDIYTELLRRMRSDGGNRFEDASRAALSTVYGRNFNDRRSDSHIKSKNVALFDRKAVHLNERSAESATQTKFSNNLRGVSEIKVQNLRKLQPIFREHSFASSSALHNGAIIDQRTKHRELGRKFHSEFDLHVGPPKFQSTPIPHRMLSKSVLIKKCAQAPNRLSKSKSVPIPKPVFHSNSPPTKNSEISSSNVFPVQSQKDARTADEQLAEVRRQLEEVRQMVQRVENPPIAEVVSDFKGIEFDFVNLISACGAKKSIFVSSRTTSSIKFSSTASSCYNHFALRCWKSNSFLNFSSTLMIDFV